MGFFAFPTVGQGPGGVHKRVRSSCRNLVRSRHGRCPVHKLVIEEIQFAAQQKLEADIRESIPKET